MSIACHSRTGRLAGLPAALCLLLAAMALGGPFARAAEPDPDTFGVLYTVWIKPETASAVVKIRLTRNIQMVDWLKLGIDPARYSRFQGTGDVLVEGNTVTWAPPEDDAWLQYRVLLTSKRDNGRFDGMITPQWALFRADDLVPLVRSSFQDFTRSNAKLEIHLPEGWSVATRYPRYTSGRLKVDDPRRSFDRPTGWLVMGQIGARRDTIGHSRVAVAAPAGQDVHYLDILAFLRWTAPYVQEVFPAFPERLLVVSAGDPMWRGALSGPGSLYVHSDRPMISGNGTSTVIHELIHVAMRARSGPGADWIVEGLAEYYSLEILRRSGAISESRFEKAQRDLAEWGKNALSLDVPRSSGPVTARAVGVLRGIDRDIREKSGGSRNLDDVVRVLAAEDSAVTVQRFNALVAEMSAVQGAVH